MTEKSQRRLSGKARQRFEQRWRATFENSAIAMMMADFTGRIFAANEAYRKMLGYTESELYRLTFLDITQEEDRAANLRLVKELQDRKRQHFQIEKRYRRKDGSLIWVRTNVTRVPGIGDIAPFWFNVVEDITQRKRVEEELRLQLGRLRETEARLQAFFEHSPNVIFLKDRQGRYLYVNKEFKRALRISDGQIKGKKDDEVFAAEQATAFQANDRRVLEGGVPMEFEETTLQEDGQHASIVHKFPLFDADGEIYAIGGIVTDITERKKEESARRLSDERYRVLVETANDAIVSINESGSILFVNPATTKIFGYDSAVLIGKPVTMLMPKFMHKMHESGFRRSLASPEPHRNWRGIEVIGLDKNGREFPVEISLGELNQDGQRIFTGFIRDISERKRAEEMRGIAIDFLTKPFRDQDVLDAVRGALKRDRARREQGQQVSKIRQHFESLTPREQEVISMVVSGMLNKQISGKLGTSENTVKVQRSRAIEKMQAQSLPDLVRMMELLKDLSEEPE
jgi:PAS domain S-box-containing protein